MSQHTIIKHCGATEVPWPKNHIHMSCRHKGENENVKMKCKIYHSTKIATVKIIVI